MLDLPTAQSEVRCPVQENMLGKMEILRVRRAGCRIEKVLQKTREHEVFAGTLGLPRVCLL